MAGQVRVDTALLQSTAQQGTNIADNMLGHASTLKTRIQFVLDNWQGGAGDSARVAMANQASLLDKLITKLQFLSTALKQGGQSLESQDASASAKVNASAQGLTSKLNF